MTEVGPGLQARSPAAIFTGMMDAMPHCTPAPDRALLKVSGEDARSFLQGLITGDVNLVAPDRSIWAALLTPQGKYLFDFFVIEDVDGGLLLDVDAGRAADLFKKLKLYKLRAKVTLERLEDGRAVTYRWGETASQPAGTTARSEGAITVVDPRHAGLGHRVISPAAADETASRLDHATHRIRLGVPEGIDDLELEKATLMENGFDELGGVAWNKGCYVGQEVTARMKYKGLAKKRLLPFEYAGPIPNPGQPIETDEKQVGEVRSVGHGVLLGLVRLDALDQTLEAGTAGLTLIQPDWIKLPERD